MNTDTSDNFHKEKGDALSLNESLELELASDGIDELRISYTYLISVVVSCGLSSMQLGAALSASGCVMPDLVYLFSIPEEEVGSAMTYVTTSAIGGVAAGSLLGGVAISRGRKLPTLVFNWIAIIGSLVSVIEHFTIICIGRFIFGFAAGVLLTAAPKVIEETVPEKL